MRYRENLCRWHQFEKELNPSWLICIRGHLLPPWWLLTKMGVFFYKVKRYQKYLFYVMYIRKIDLTVVVVFICEWFWKQSYPPECIRPILYRFYLCFDLYLVFYVGSKQELRPKRNEKQVTLEEETNIQLEKGVIIFQVYFKPFYNKQKNEIHTIFGNWHLFVNYLLNSKGRKSFVKTRILNTKGFFFFLFF